MFNRSALETAIEIDAPEGAKPLLWRLITTLPAGNLAEAMEAVRLYRLRWRSEQLFRTLKKDGLDLEATQLEKASRTHHEAGCTGGYCKLPHHATG